MRLLMGAQAEGDLCQEATLRVVDDRVIEAIGRQAIVVDTHHIDIADDQALFVGETRSLNEELTDLGDEALTCEDGIRRALTIASGGIDVAAEVLRGEPADEATQVGILPCQLVARREVEDDLCPVECQACPWSVGRPHIFADLDTDGELA